MRAFYHHVGREGSARDFPRTVFKAVDLSRIERSIPERIRERFGIVESLRREFPAGACNVWGVPPGAKSVISNLSRGDAALLIEEATIHGLVPALAIVRVYWPVQLIDLSFELWGEERFPYIFFFNTERLTYTWPQFMDDMAYKNGYNPRGQFLSIAPAKLSSFGGADGYVQYLRRGFSRSKRVNR